MSLLSRKRSISKALSPNDLGLTGSHQAGILVPKEERILSFFPQLDKSSVNPSCEVSVKDVESDTIWNLRFVYYNGKVRNEGTRNEYRLTRMTELLRQLRADPGDALIFERTPLGDIEIRIDKAASGSGRIGSATSEEVTVLRGGWTLIES